MSNQPEALRLADMQSIDAYACRTLTALELRRQHALIAELVDVMKDCREVIESLERQSDIWAVFGNRVRAALTKAKAQQ